MQNTQNRHVNYTNNFS